MAEKYDDIMNIILPTLRSKEEKHIALFLPLCPDTGKVLEIPMLNLDKNTGKIIFDNQGKKFKQVFTMVIVNYNGKLTGQ